MELSTRVQKTVKLARATNDIVPEWVEDDRLARIAVTAYYKAEVRGYEPGHEVQDWLDAEIEINACKESVK